MNNRTKLGLIGRGIAYSFSRKYFLEKFKELNLEHMSYENYDLPEIDEFPFIIYMKRDEFIGFNVTIPYKQKIIKYLDKLDPVAEEIGAVNTIKINEEDQLVGYNTDAFGFETSIKPLLKKNYVKALIFGTGGASKAIIYVLNTLGISHQYVSRNPSNVAISYDDLTVEMIQEHSILINCTPLGTYPNITECPPIPYEGITVNHILFDLIYNPDETKFLKEGKIRGAVVKSGLEMLEQQAEKAWTIWNS